MTTDPYLYDVFLSYRRRDEWPGWVDRHFLPILRHWLGEELCREPRIFIDTNIETGNIWPDSLASGLSQSAVLLPLLCGSYFTSQWCTIEYHLIERRETLCDAQRLILPALLHNGDSLPNDVRARQLTDLRSHVRTRMPKRSARAERLEGAIMEWAPAIREAIDAAPPLNPDWNSITVDAMTAVFDDREQTAKPVWSL